MSAVQIRASTPMFLMSRKIKAMGVKMVLSGADYMLLSAFSKVFARPSSLSTCSLTAFALTLLAAGEGSDEVFGGYLYFHKAPSKVEKGSGFCVKSNCSVTIVYCLQLLVTHTLAFHVLRGHLPMGLCLFAMSESLHGLGQ